MYECVPVPAMRATIVVFVLFLQFFSLSHFLSTPPAREADNKCIYISPILLKTHTIDDDDADADDEMRARLFLLFPG